MSLRKFMWSSEIVLLTASTGVAMYAYGMLNLGVQQYVEEGSCGYEKRFKEEP
jgi:hypothetical protein